MQELNRVSLEIEAAVDLSPLSPLLAEDQAKLENASATASEITSQVLAQKLELDEKKHSVVVLQKALVSVFILSLFTYFESSLLLAENIPFLVEFKANNTKHFW